MPNEIRLKCIEKMDFVKRYRLSCTSTTERSLIDLMFSREKYHFDRIDFTCNENGIDMYTSESCDSAEDVCLETDSRVGNVRKVELLRHLLTTCDVEELDYSHEKGFERYCRDPIVIPNYLLPLRVKKLTLLTTDPKIMEFFLDNSPVNIVKEVRLHICQQFGPLWARVQQWIEKDADIGSSLQFLYSSVCMTRFAEHFADRVIHRTAAEVLIRTNNTNKQILLRDINMKQALDAFVVCRVIPTDLPRSEYKKGDEWIREVRHFEFALSGQIPANEEDSEPNDE